MLLCSKPLLHMCYFHATCLQALIVPIIHRGLRDRTGDVKKRAARIAGNMASLVNDPKVRVPCYAHAHFVFPKPTQPPTWKLSMQI